MFNEQENITPELEDYKEAIKHFKEHVKKDMKEKKGLQKSTQAFRLVYYDLVVEALKKQKSLT